MAKHSSASTREPHVNQTTKTTQTINDLKQTRGTDEDNSSAEKIEALAEIICGGGDESAAALLVLMGTLQNSADPKTLANTVKHFAFTRCGELNVGGMVDAQIAIMENELVAGNLISR